MKPRIFLALLAAPSLVILGIIWLTDLPLGVPAEWTWVRVGPPIDTLLTAVMVVIYGLLFAGFIWLGQSRLTHCRELETTGWLIGLVLIGFCWLWIAQDAAPPGYRFSKTAWTLFYPGASGYFSMARDHEEDFDRFLRDYESLMAEGDVLHIGTHPPGLFMGYHSLISLCRASPALCDWVRSTEAATYSEAMDIIAQNHVGSSNSPQPEHRAAIWLAALLTQLAAAATVVPLFLLIRRDFSPQIAWLAVSCWPAIPALALFLPKSDLLYPLFGMACWYFWLSGWKQRSFWRILLAGFICWAGLTCSLALLPVLLGLFLMTLWRGWFCQTADRVPDALSKFWFGLLGAAIGFLTPLIALWWLKGVNLLNVWLWNYRNHAGFYDEYTRTYWKWLLINPLEFAVAVGVPLTVAAILGGYSLAKHAPRSRRAGILWCSLIVWGLLWLSGKNMGELARLWILLMPWVVWLAAGCLSREEPSQNSMVTRRWAILFTMQLIMQIALVMRTHGFHRPEVGPAQAQAPATQPTEPL